MNCLDCGDMALAKLEAGAAVWEAFDRNGVSHRVETVFNLSGFAG